MLTLFVTQFSSKHECDHEGKVLFKDAVGSCSTRNAVFHCGLMKADTTRCVYLCICETSVYCSTCVWFYVLATVMCLCDYGDSDEFTILTLADIGCESVNN